MNQSQTKPVAVFSCQLKARGQTSACEVSNHLFFILLPAVFYHHSYWLQMVKKKCTLFAPCFPKDILIAFWQGCETVKRGAMAIAGVQARLKKSWLSGARAFAGDSRWPLKIVMSGRHGPLHTSFPPPALLCSTPQSPANPSLKISTSL